ncbi:MAG: hypothetical protein IJV37_00520, partial [Bacteroidales bacterium]|nr:hypothetical protein [Bacteroidales bacterium]
ALEIIQDRFCGFQKNIYLWDKITDVKMSRAVSFSAALFSDIYVTFWRFRIKPGMTDDLQFHD